MFLRGLSGIDFGSNSLETCTSNAQIGSMTETTVNESGCAGWQKNVGFRTDAKNDRRNQ